METHSHRIEFVGSQSSKLAARLDRPISPPRGYALFAHCFTCSKDSLAASRIAGGLAERGIAVLRFDFTGLGASDGEFANTNFSSNVEDLVSAADFLRAEHAAPTLLIGHSLGGAAVLAAADRIPEARAVATIAAPVDPAHVERLFTDARAEIEARGEAVVSLAGRRFRIRKQFLDDIGKQPLTERVARMRKALLVFHAPLDNMVEIDNAAKIFQAAKHPKSFISLDGADHLLSRREDAEYVAAVLSAWASRYVDATGPGLASRDPDTPRRVTVLESTRGTLLREITIGPHRLLADEPTALGGTDAGPSPYDLLLAGLGACTSMTLRMYADRKQWPLASVKVLLSHGKIHASDCSECETREGKIDQIDREITISGDLDADQRKRLIEIADRCPVHRTLSSEIRIRTRATIASDSAHKQTDNH
jgi:putative redox protein